MGRSAGEQVDYRANADEYIKRALAPCEPYDFMGRARQAVEAILLEVLVHVVGPPSKRLSLDNLVRHEMLRGIVPDTIRACAETIRAIGNLGSHPGERAPSEWSREDVRTPLVAFADVVRWYYGKFREVEMPDAIRLFLYRDARTARNAEERMKVDALLFGARYRLDEVLGTGAAAVVYRAHDTSLDRMIALKVLKEELLEESGLVQRIRREARKASKLSHPHVLRVLDLGELRDGRPYLVMDVAVGRTLADRIRSGLTGLLLAACWMDQLLSALAAIHDAGVIHRDVKPSNVLLDANDAILLSDFGIAADRSELTRLTRSGEQLGTAGYMAPEVQHDPGAISPGADVYAAALVIQEVLTGKPFPPGKGIADPLGSLLRRMGSADVDERPSARSALKELRAPGAMSPRGASNPAPPTQTSDATAVRGSAVPATPIAAQVLDLQSGGPSGPDGTGDVKLSVEAVDALATALEGSVLDRARVSDRELARQFELLPVRRVRTKTDARRAAARAAIVERLVRQGDARATARRLSDAIADVTAALSVIGLAAWHERLAVLEEALGKHSPLTERATHREQTLWSRRNAVEMEPGDAARVDRLVRDELHVAQVESAAMLAVAHALHAPSGIDWSTLQHVSDAEQWQLLCAVLADYAERRPPAVARRIERMADHACPALHAALGLAYVGRWHGEQIRAYPGIRHPLRAALQQLECALRLEARDPDAWPWWDAAVRREADAVRAVSDP